MKKIILILAIIFISASLSSCGTWGNYCCSSYSYNNSSNDGCCGTNSYTGNWY